MLKWMGALCLFWALVFYAAGFTGWYAICEFSMFAFFLCLFAAFICANLLFIQEARRKYFWPRCWDEAGRVYPAPRHIHGRRVPYRFLWLRSGPGRSLAPVSGICAREGLVLRDPMPLFSLGRVCVPWKALSPPIPVKLPWHVGGFQEVVESSVAGLPLSVVAVKDTWEQSIAPWVNTVL